MLFSVAFFLHKLLQTNAVGVVFALIRLIPLPYPANSCLASLGVPIPVISFFDVRLAPQSLAYGRLTTGRGVSG